MHTSIGMQAGDVPLKYSASAVDEFGNGVGDDKSFKVNSPQDRAHILWSHSLQPFKKLDIPGQLYSSSTKDPSRPNMIDRDAVLRTLGYHLHGDPILYLDPRHFPNPSTVIYSTEPKGFMVEPNSCSGAIQVIRLWGFAGCTQWDGEFATMYYNAAKQVAQKLEPGTKDVMLQYDGDACWEKKGNKFSHNIVVGLVGQTIREVVPGVKIHLLITKYDEDDLDKMAAKFGTVTKGREGHYPQWMILRTTIGEFNASDPKHFYPNHTLREEGRAGFFDSISLVLSSGYGGASAGASEPKNMRLTELFLNLAIVNGYLAKAEKLKAEKELWASTYDDAEAYRIELSLEEQIEKMVQKGREAITSPVPPKFHCICIGGNTESGIQAVVGAGYRFESVSRAYLAAKK